MRSFLTKVAIIAFLIQAGVVEAGFIGSKVVADRRYPDFTTILESRTATVGPGVEFTSIIGEVSADISDNRITVKPLITGTYGGGAFNGYTFTFTGASKITGVTVDPTSTFGPVIVSFTFNQIALNYGGATVDFPFAAQTLLNVTFAPSAPGVPLPSGLCGGLAALLAVGYSRKRVFRCESRPVL